MFPFRACLLIVKEVPERRNRQHALPLLPLCAPIRDTVRELYGLRICTRRQGNWKVLESSAGCWQIAGRYWRAPESTGIYRVQILDILISNIIGYWRILLPVPNNIQYLHIGCYWVLADIIGEDWEGINGIGGSLEGIAGCLGGIGERRQLHEVTLQQPSSLRGTDGYYWRVLEGTGGRWRVR